MNESVQRTIQELRAKRDSIDTIINGLESMFGAAQTVTPARPSVAPTRELAPPASRPRAPRKAPAGGKTIADLCRDVIKGFTDEFPNASVFQAIVAAGHQFTSTQVAQAMLSLRNSGEIVMARKVGPTPFWRRKI